MKKKATFLLIAGVLGAWFIYIPLPANFEESWKLTWIMAPIRATTGLALFADYLGIIHFVNSLMFFIGFLEVPPTSDENVIVTETFFNSVPVRVYVPKRKSEILKKGLLYVHGGGWCLLGAAFYNYDYLSRSTAHSLDAVVVSVNYRLVPKYHFPSQFEDVYNALKWFVRQDVLEEYGIDSERIGIAGDSAGGNLAAAVTQQFIDDPDVKIKLKIQALIYPVLQTLDMNLPSYQDNADLPFLTRSLMIRFWSDYFTTDRSLEKAMLFNQHIPMELSHLFQFVNWSSLLPERFVKGHIYRHPIPGSSELVKKYPGLLDVRAAPLLADESKLHGLPLTYIITCQHDILRDDGLLYVARLQNAGVNVTHDHIEDGFHGLLAYMWLEIKDRTENQYLSWLRQNL
ncbi:arylacetamide deacetylase-like [Dipodomys spectabilis]|uniref:arylacetamide deacetylase-like n=1 Tax=Dipodomys spectabilis TaxID=105255 RepID=UPI001C542640|nr:arylacetamide deacetylase-like [Dipodomys spectabilis]XP_042556954.1 arylacetamide deacetylase-like [Dipodomys spectabilis]